MAEPTQEQWLEIQGHLSGGRKIQAIKVYREATGVGLKEAKDAMEAYYEKLRAEAPDRFPEQAKSGCAGAILIGFIMGAGIAVAWQLMA